jgi:putative ABC transport system ATP-binding protein
MTATSAASASPSPPLIAIEDLTRVYRMGGEEVRALDGVSLRIDAGELVAIVGQSGSGKSTLMSLLGCLDTPTTGRYALAGIPVQDLDADDLAEVRGRLIGFVFQSFHLLPRQTALENVTLPLVYRRGDVVPRRQRLERAAAALELVGLKDRMHHRPAELSGGQRQRVAIARALVHEPSVILADEPTGNLDSRTTDEILALLVDLNERHRRTVLIITHEPDVAARCRRVVQLKDGRVLRDGPPAPAG